GLFYVVLNDLVLPACALPANLYTGFIHGDHRAEGGLNRRVHPGVYTLYHATRTDHWQEKNNIFQKLRKS
ncbi:hypothetical protein, partial [Pseudomonas syringae group genomosp. 7]|uniref:hypothetical protein n=1 Tax=Pseudomonas syringae group genomosp. 7 TaxID=251699 RepID=UPI00376FB203